MHAKVRLFIGITIISRKKCLSLQGNQLGYLHERES